jgi:hypothetical protein
MAINHRRGNFLGIITPNLVLSEVRMPAAPVVTFSSAMNIYGSSCVGAHGGFHVALNTALHRVPQGSFIIDPGPPRHPYRAMSSMLQPVLALSSFAAIVFSRCAPAMFAGTRLSSTPPIFSGILVFGIATAPMSSTAAMNATLRNLNRMLWLQRSRAT